MWCIHSGAGTRNAPAAIQRLEPIHDPCDILTDIQITACQFFQCAQALLSVIDRLKMVATQELSQLARIDSITLTTVFQQGILARITNHDFADMRLQQSYNQAAQVPSSKVTCTSPRSPSMNCRSMLPLVSMTHSITSLPAAFITAIEILSLCTSMPIYLVIVIKGVPFWRG